MLVDVDVLKLSFGWLFAEISKYMGYLHNGL